MVEYVSLENIRDFLDFLSLLLCFFAGIDDEPDLNQDLNHLQIKTKNYWKK